MERLYFCFRRGPEAGRRIALPSTGQFRLGRDPSMDIPVPDSRLSRKHCRIEVETEKRLVLVEDLNSSNGIYINKQRVTKAWMRPGDRLYLGNSIIELQARDEDSTQGVRPESDAQRPMDDRPPHSRAGASSGSGAPAPAPSRRVSTAEFDRNAPLPAAPVSVEPPDAFKTIPAPPADLVEPSPSSFGGPEGPSRLDVTEQLFATPAVGVSAGSDRAAGVPPKLDSIIAQRAEMSSAADPLVGQMVANYTIEELIGAGMVGRTYRCRHGFMKQPFAIKIMHPGLSHDPETLDAFLQEARVGGQLEHPNIVRVVNAGQFQGQYYLVMEYVDGVNLRHVIEHKGPLPDLEVVRIGRNLCTALHFTHSKGIIHRNIKPDNVLIEREGNVRLADIGLSLVSGGIGSTITSPQQQVASSAYQAPELLTGRDPGTEQSDIYSVGATLYFALTGRPPFDADRVVALVKQVLAYPPTPIQEHAPDTDAEIADVIEHAMAKEPADRWKSAAEFARALERYTGEDNTF